MATGDPLQINWNSATASSFIVRITGIGDLTLQSFSVDQANNRWSGIPQGGSWPLLNSTMGTTASPGSIQVLTAPAGLGQIEDVEGNVLAPNTVIFSRAITIDPPAIVASLTASYQSGLGTNGDPITASGSLGSGALIITVNSVED